MLQNGQKWGNCEEEFEVKFKLKGAYAKYYKFLKDIYFELNPQGSVELEKFIVESGLLDVMRSIWTMFLSEIVLETEKEKGKGIPKS